MQRRGRAAHAQAPEERRAQWLVVAVLGACLLALFAVLIWARNRGFDLTDEGLYLLAYERPGETEFLSRFYRVVDVLNGPFTLSLPSLRICRLVVLSSSSMVFGAAFWRALAARVPSLSAHLPSRSVSVLFCGVLGLLGYSWLPAGLSYNDLAAAIVLLAGAALLVICRQPEPWASEHARRTRAIALLLGALLPLHIAIKFSSAAAMWVLIVGVGGALVGARATGRVVFWAGVGSVGALALLLVPGINGAFSVSDLTSALNGTAGSLHSPANLLGLYWETSWLDSTTVLSDHPTRVVALAIVLGGSGLLVPRSSRVARTLLIGAMVASAWYLLGEASALYSGHEGYFARVLKHEFVLSALLAVVIVLPMGIVVRRIRLGTWHLRGEWRAATAIAGFALLAPFAAAVGTGNSRLILVGISAGAAFACFILFGLTVARSLLPSPGIRSSALVTSLPVLAIIITVQIFHGTVRDPYRLTTDLSHQNTELSVPPRLKGVRVDEASAVFLSTLYNVVTTRTDFESGDPVLAIAHMPGLVWAIDGTPAAGVAWINYPVPPELQADNCAQLAKGRRSIERTRVVLQNTSPSPPLERCLRGMLPAFPQGFSLVAELQNPYAPIGPYSPTLKVYSSSPVR